ncbi:MAG TPA: 2-phosphosulfolactate phosphatase [Ignavibacteriaceae bacterium]|jgi:2-phosphosulfolactate phosphatase|nr:2-phosphosulfolactate phosphatase [Ignavibacteriaceae bacterium]
MRVNVLFSPVIADELFFTRKTVIVIDVLRASTTIITALQNGAREIVPVATVEFGVKISGGMFGGQTLLGGERNTKKVEGFALGNSPLEYTPEIVSGKTIILYTTNGSKAIVKAKFSENLYVCSFLNLGAIAEQVIKTGKDFEILCAGKSNTFSLEDSVCAGRLIQEVINHKEGLEITDTSRVSVSLNNSFGENPFEMLKETEHGKLLLQNGFEDDLKYAAGVDTSNVIPYLATNVLKSLPGDNGAMNKN